MAHTTQKWIDDTRVTERENAKRQEQGIAPELPSSTDHSAAPQDVATIDPFDHAVKDLEAVVPSAKK
jgi:hypothetical protein